MNRQPLRICWIKDDKPGHLTKVRGLIKALGKITNISVVECSVRWRPSFLRSLLARIPFLREIYPLNCCLDVPDSPESFDLIISSGGATEWANVKLSRLYGIKNVFFGSLRAYAATDFSALPKISTSSKKNAFRLKMMPSVMNYSYANTEAEDFFKGKIGKTWSVLIGGNGSGVFWELDDWMLLASGIIDSANKAGVKLIVTTSRRTGVIAEKALKSVFEKSGLLACAVWYHQQGIAEVSPSIAAMIGQSELVCVTEDSASMINEAVASGRPVVTLKPLKSNPDRVIEEMLSKFAYTSHIFRNPSLEQIEISANMCDWTFVDDDWHTVLGNEIFDFLELSR